MEKIFGTIQSLGETATPLITAIKGNGQPAPAVQPGAVVALPADPAGAPRWLMPVLVGGAILAGVLVVWKLVK